MMRCRNVIAAHTLNLRRDHRRVEGDPRKLVFAGAPATDLFRTATSSNAPEQVSGQRRQEQQPECEGGRHEEVSQSG